MMLTLILSPDSSAPIQSLPLKVFAWTEQARKTSLAPGRIPRSGAASSEDRHRKEQAGHRGDKQYRGAGVSK